jgi:TonB-linked SusC/RagA family outer membrane protein
VNGIVLLNVATKLFFIGLLIMLAPPRGLAQKKEIRIQGKVINNDGKTIERASLRFRGKVLFADKDGKFSLDAAVGDSLVVSSVGYKTERRIIKGIKMSIVLQMSEQMLEEAVINTGLFNINKDSFTGNTRTISGKELRNVSRQNILEGLNILDPSFKMIADNNMGSDPNQLPRIEFRGKTAALSNLGTNRPDRRQLQLEYEQDPNQPLFILDGFETTLRTILDLDVNRVARVTLLKDAASTALYGSKAANGIVVIETIKPTPGELRLSYNMSVRYQIPDLSGYNLMDARQLYEFQEKVGLFDSDEIAYKLQQERNKNNILNGVNSQWHNVVLRNVLSFNHSLGVEGGDENFLYGINLSASKNPGLIRGDETKAYNAQLRLQYRKNRINVSNNLTIVSDQGKASAYGSFKKYIRIPPYFPVLDQYGELANSQYLDSVSKIINPLYDGSLPHVNQRQGLSLVNNFGIQWDPFTGFRLSTDLQLSTTRGKTDYFISPLSTDFKNVTNPQEKGSYEQSQERSNRISSQLTMTYAKVFAKRHVVNIRLNGSVNHNYTDKSRVLGLGFAVSAAPLLHRAAGYKNGDRPSGSENIVRDLTYRLNANYSYDQRYNFDFTYSRSGTSRFGASNPFNNYYAVGLGWNVGNEAFFNKNGWMNNFRITANIGVTGNESGSSYSSVNTFLLQHDPATFGEAMRIAQIGTPELKGAQTRSTTVNLLAEFLKSRINLSVSGYEKYTSPLIIKLPIPASSGISELPENLGNLTTRGLDLVLNARLIQGQNWDWSFGWNAPLWKRSKYAGIEERLKYSNNKAMDLEYMLRYRDGSSPDAVWAVRSLGIDPANGWEIFQNKDGQSTYRYDKKDEVDIGSNLPATQGVISSMVRYKAFSLSIYAQYAIGQMQLNEALYSKTENIAEPWFNQDRRALEGHWMQPGDVVGLKRILKIGAYTSPMSSRFIQKENYFDVSSVNINYDFSQLTRSFRKSLGLQSLEFSVNMNEFLAFRLSNIRLERGIDSPFARSITGSLRIGF